MELEELAKRIEWLEKEHRKDRATIAALEQNIVDYDTALTVVKNHVKELANDQTSAKNVSTRIDLIEKQLAQSRIEVGKTLEEHEKRRAKIDKEQADRLRAEGEITSRMMMELRQSIDSFQDVRRSMQSRVNEEARLSKTIAELEKKIKEHTAKFDELAHDRANNDDAKRSDQKKLLDLQTELQITRKRNDDLRDKLEINLDTIQQLDHRINELLVNETERKQAQIAFIDQQNLDNIERERSWKEAINRLDNMRRQGSDLDQKLVELDELERAINRTKDGIEDATNRLERRINEITEIQRINEERFRQEWIGLKSDDQKRWTNFTLLQDDSNKTQQVQVEKIIERITLLEDLYQSLKDVMDLTNEATESHLLELLNWSHDYLTTLGRITGNTKPGV